MPTLLIIVLLVGFLFAATLGPTNLRSLAWVLVVIVLVALILNMISLVPGR